MKDLKVKEEESNRKGKGYLSEQTQQPRNIVRKVEQNKE